MEDVLSWFGQQYHGGILLIHGQIIAREYVSTQVEYRYIT
jgi:hypothetical protein